MRQRSFPPGGGRGWREHPEGASGQARLGHPSHPSLGPYWHLATALGVLAFPRSWGAWWGPGLPPGAAPTSWMQSLTERQGPAGHGRPGSSPGPAFPGNVTWEATLSLATRTSAVMSGQQHCPSSQFAHCRSSSERMGCHPRTRAPQELPRELPPPQAGRTRTSPQPWPWLTQRSHGLRHFNLPRSWAGRGLRSPREAVACPRPPVERGRARSQEAFTQSEGRRRRTVPRPGPQSDRPRQPWPRDPTPSRHADYLLTHLEGVLAKSTARGTLPGS